MRKLQPVVSLTDPTFLVPTIIAVGALVVSVAEIRRERKDREISRAMLDLIKTMREDLKRVQQPIYAQSPGILSESELRKREALQWQKLKDVAKAVGWIWDRLEEDDES